MNLRGNFAFVFQNKERTVGAVDHIASTNLFYSNHYVCHIFVDLQDLSPKRDIVHVKWQKEFFCGGSVGPETNNRAILRLEPGTYFEKKTNAPDVTVHTYIDLYTHEPDPSITRGDISDIVEQIVEENTRDPFNMLWSSGTDSNCILGFVRKLKRTDRCQLVSLYSDQSPTDERPQIQYLENVYGLKTNYQNLGRYIGITDEMLARVRSPDVADDYRRNFERTWQGFWYEANVFQKYTALYDLGIQDRITLTGEVGDQIFGSRFGKLVLNYVTQVVDPKSEDISKLFVIADCFRFNRAGVVPHVFWSKALDKDPTVKQAWDHTNNWVCQTWNQINTGGDIINQVELLQYLYKGSHRIYNYGQMLNCNFQHPFADYRLFHTVFKTPGSWKVSQGKTRRLSLDIIKDYVDPGPWTWAKSGIFVSRQYRYVK